MTAMIQLGLVGDRDDAVTAHRAIPAALRLAGEALATPLSFEWVPTEEVTDVSRVAHYDALWCVPASPYRSMDGALRAIRFAREQRRPFLGTCGGFQHAVIEYARNVLGWSDAEHAETAPEAQRAVIAPLECSLVEATGAVRFRAGTRIAQAYGCAEATEGYRCRYGLNPDFQAALVSSALRVSAEDDAGDVRAVELDGHPFFVATLFQPERAALAGQLPPLVAGLIRACAGGEAMPSRPGSSPADR
ncbi:CTP synthase [Sorangium sp. So ce321]